MAKDDVIIYTGYMKKQPETIASTTCVEAKKEALVMRILKLLAFDAVWYLFD